MTEGGKTVWRMLRAGNVVETRLEDVLEVEKVLVTMLRERHVVDHVVEGELVLNLFDQLCWKLFSSGGRR